MTVLNYKDLPRDIPYGAQVSIDTNSVTQVTHGFHKYPGKFIPQIPKWAINTYLNDDNQLILDPFVGSGTTLVEATIHGYNSYGIDIDPLSCLISKVKSTPLDPNQFLLISEWILNNKETAYPNFFPEIDTLDHWFTEDSSNKLSKLRTLINEIPTQFKYIENINDYFDAFIIAFSGIIRRVSNADNQSQKTYVSGTKPKKPAEVYSLFTKQLGLFLKGFRTLQSIDNKRGKAVVLKSNGDADIKKTILDKVDLIITSPPYIKSIDYVYNQMVELFWVGDLFSMNTQPKQNKKRKLYTGTTLVPKKQYKDFFDEKRSFGIEIMDESLRSILRDEKNGEKHAYIVYKYFDFMNQHFKASSQVMKKGAHYVMAIGNSSVSNTEINTADILISLANGYGLELETRWSYIIKNHFMGFDRGNRGGKINVDHMLIFKRN